MVVAPRHCSYHQQRPAFAACMACARTLCQECATQWDGIWHCAACLATKRGAAVRRSAIPGWLSLGAATLILLYASARMMVWTSVLLAGLM